MRIKKQSATAPSRSSIRFKQIARKGCQTYPDDAGCNHEYQWVCDHCPVIILRNEERMKFDKSLNDIKFVPQNKMWECPTCGQLENKEVTFFEHCTFCGADVV